MKTKIAAALILVGMVAAANAEVRTRSSFTITIGDQRPEPREVVVVREEPETRVVYVERERECHRPRRVVYVQPAPRCDRRVYLTELPRRDEGRASRWEARDNDRGNDRVAMDDGRGRGRNR